MTPLDILKQLREKDNRVILFHSATGKDSIVLTHLCSGLFDEVICVFMYYVKDLEQNNKYINYFEKKYKNVKFEQIPHFNLNRLIKYGQLGAKAIPNIKIETLRSIALRAQERHGIKNTVIGFKKTDSLNRRLMLNEFGYNFEKTNFWYPLLDVTDKFCLEYIKRNILPSPISYDDLKSSGVDLVSGTYLSWCKKNYPKDLEKIFTLFPLSQTYLFEYENKTV